MSTIKVGDILRTKGLVNDKQLAVALAQQKVTGDLFGDVLIKLGFVSAAEFARAIAEQSGIEYIDLSEQRISEEALKIVPKDVAEKTGFIPFDMEDGVLSIGITNPSNIAAIDTATRITKKHPKVYIVDADSFRDSLEKAYFFLQNPIQQRIDSVIGRLEGAAALTGNAVVSLVELFIMDGIRRNATDIHINPTSDVIHVFYRIDGVLQHGHCVPKNALTGIVSRIKILSQLDIAEQRLPQDGSIRFTILNKNYDIRVSTFPTIHGEDVVMRVLSESGHLLKMEGLGFDPADVETLKALFRKSYGIVLMTGPTGSGKTTTLYAALREMDLLERNVITVEDPVEFKLSLIKQTQVNEKVGYDFGSAGRNFMRQDPDVILLGEIRDEETAKIAVRASITGHLVLSTLHANDAVTAIPRLIYLDVDRFLLASSLVAVISQRLVRKVCSYCSREHPLTDYELSVFRESGIHLTSSLKGSGCRKCGGTGYSGRTVIGEILVIDDEIREMIDGGSSAASIKAAAIKKGMLPLKEAALKKVAVGITTLEEVMRVAG